MTSLDGRWNMAADNKGGRNTELVDMGYTESDGRGLHRYTFYVEGTPGAAYIGYNEGARRAFVAYGQHHKWVDGELLAAQCVALEMMEAG